MQRMIPVSLIVAAVCGCVAAGSGTRALRRLSEPSGVGIQAKPTAGATTWRSQSMPVALAFPDGGSVCTVTREDWLGDSVGDAAFPGGAIVEREFRKVAAAYFSPVSGDDVPAAVFTVGMTRSSVRQTPGGTSATIGVRIEIKKSGGRGVCYSETFEETAVATWPDRRIVPEAFYLALEAVVSDFSRSWESDSAAVSTLRKWRDELNPGAEPPELETIAWEQEDDVWKGECEVACNGYEGFEARSWATSQLASLCRAKLGGIEQERVRVVYDEMDYDRQTKRWRFSFRTFARTRIVLTYDRISRRGAVTGDMELMNMGAEAASEELKRFVQNEMDSRAGKVTREKPKGDAEIRFDDFETDSDYNLVTIRFRLL